MSRSRSSTEDWTPIPDLEPDAVCQTRKANQAAVAMVLSADPHDDDGRSEFFWLRLPNDSLVLACYPQGDTYSGTETDWGRG